MPNDTTIAALKKMRENVALKLRRGNHTAEEVETLEALLKTGKHRTLPHDWGEDEEWVRRITGHLTEQEMGLLKRESRYNNTKKLQHAKYREALETLSKKLTKLFSDRAKLAQMSQEDTQALQMVMDCELPDEWYYDPTLVRTIGQFLTEPEMAALQERSKRRLQYREYMRKRRAESRKRSQPTESIDAEAIRNHTQSPQIFEEPTQKRSRPPVSKAAQARSLFECGESYNTSSKMVKGVERGNHPGHIWTCSKCNSRISQADGNSKNLVAHLEKFHSWTWSDTMQPHSTGDTAQSPGPRDTGEGGESYEDDDDQQTGIWGRQEQNHDEQTGDWGIPDKNEEDDINFNPFHCLEWESIQPIPTDLDHMDPTNLDHMDPTDWDHMDPSGLTSVIHMLSSLHVRLLQCEASPHI